MSNQIVQLQSGSLPEGFCHTDWQSTFATFASLMRGELAGGGTNVLVSDTEPAAEFRTSLWFRLNGDGSPDRLYFYFSGKWCSPYRVPSISSELILWTGAAADVDTYDGGTVGVVTDTTGPFWQIEAAMAGRSPMGPGTLASGQVIAVGTDFGEERHDLILAELVPHTHVVTIPISAGGAGAVHQVGTGDTSANAQYTSANSTGAGDPFNVVHPIHGTYFLKRTLRKFWVP